MERSTGVSYSETLALVTGGSDRRGCPVAGFRERPGPWPIVPKDDPRLETGYIKYPGANGEIRAYSARPKGATKLAGVIVIHENRGLNPHIEDMARRVALEGFLAIAPDALSPLGGHPGEPRRGPAPISEAGPRGEHQELRGRCSIPQDPAPSDRQGRLHGILLGRRSDEPGCGQCPGSDCRGPLLRQPAGPEDVPKIKAAMLIHYAGDDQRINAGIPAFEEALKKAGVEYTIHSYEGAGHAFMNDTGQRYNKEAAELAWQRTVEFLKAKLKS